MDVGILVFKFYYQHEYLLKLEVASKLKIIADLFLFRHFSIFMILLLSDREREKESERARERERE